MQRHRQHFASSSALTRSLMRLAGGLAICAPLAFAPFAAHAQGVGGAAGAHGISDPVAGSSGSNGVLTSGGGGGGGGGANTKAANGGTGGKGGSGKHGHGGGDGGAPGPGVSRCKPQGASAAHGCSGEGNRNGANGIPVVPFAGAGHDGGSGGGGGGGQSLIVRDHYASGANDTHRGGNGGEGGAGGHGGNGHNGLLVIPPIVAIPTPGPAGSGGGGGGGGGGGVAVTVTNGGSASVNDSSSLYGGNGGAGGRGGDGGMGAPTIGAKGLPNIPRTDGNGGDGGNGGQGGAALFLPNGGSAFLDTNALLRGGNGGLGGTGGDGSKGESLAGWGGAGGVGGSGGAGLIASGGLLSVHGQVSGGTGGNGGIGGNAINNSIIEGLTSAAGAGGRGGDGGAGAILGAGSQLIITASGGVIGGRPGAGGAAGDGGGHQRSGFGSRPYGPGAAGVAGVGILAQGDSLHIVNAGQISGGTNADGSLAAAISFFGGANTLELRAGSSIIGRVIATPNASAPNTLALGGDQDATFDLSSIGAQYLGFSVLAKTGTSNWTLSNSLASSINDVRADGGILTIGNGVRLTDMNGYVGFAAGGKGEVDISGASSAWRNTNLFVGVESNGTLNIRDGALVSAVNASIGNGTANSGNGRVWIDGAGSILDTRNLTIGGASVGNLILSNNGRVRATALQVGTSAGAGTLSIGAAAGDALMAPGVISGAINLTPDGALVFNHTSGDYLFNNLITGAGSIDVMAGTTILSGSNVSFAGTTDIRNATLRVTGELGGAVSVDGGGRLTGNGTVGTTTVNSGGTLAPDGTGGLTINGNLALLPGGAFDFHLGHSSIGGSTTSATVAVNGDLALAGATLNISASGEPAIGYYRMMTYTGNGPAPGSTMTIGTTPPDPGPFNVAYAVDTGLANKVDLVVFPNGINVLQTWVDGTGPWTGTSHSWLDTIGGIVPASWGSDYGVFRGVGETVTIEGTQSFAGLQFVSGVYNLVAGAGGELRPTAFGGGSGIGELRVLAGESATISAPIVGTGGINKSGGGTLVLDGVNTYSGGTTISGGTLQVSTANNLGSGVLAFDNGTLHVTGLVDWHHDVSLLGIGKVDIDASQTLIFTNPVSGAGSLVKTGAGTLQLNNPNSWTGGTLIEAGTIQLGFAGALPDRSDVVITGGRLDLNAFNATLGSLIGLGGEVALSGGMLTLDQASDTLIASTITGIGGRLVKTGDGTLLLSGSNTYTGGTTIAGGTVAISADFNLGQANGNVTLAGGRLFTFGDISSSRNIVLTGAGTVETLFGTTYATTGNVSGAGALTKDGWGTLILSGNTNPGGGTTIAAGTLQIGNGGATGSLTGDVTNHGVLAFNSSLSGNYSGVISGTGALVQRGSSTLALSSDNTYTGGTLISSGHLQLGLGGTSGSITGDVINNRGLSVYRSDTYTFGGTISGTGLFRQMGTGTTILTADNTYAGGTTITQGTLQIGGGGLAGSIVGDIVNDGALVAKRDGLLTLAGAISGSGSFTQAGPGITRLGGQNSYTGATDVKAGALSVNGSIAASSLVNVERGATLSGNGIVSTTNIADGGMLSPGNSVGLLTVQGNLTFAAAASYMVEVSGATADRTNVTGTAALGNATVRVSFDRASFVRERYTILNAAGGVASTFSGGIYSDEPPSFVSTLSYDANNVYLNVDLKMTGLNINQTNIANSLNTYFGTHGGIPYVLGAMVPEDLTQASGELSTSVQQNTVQAMTQFMGVMTDPFAANRGLATSGNTSSAFAEVDRPAWRDAYGAVTKAAPVAFESRWNVWAAGFGGGQSTNGNAVVGSHNSNSRIGGLAVGADTWLSPQTLAGFAMAGGGTSFGLSDRLGSGQSDLFQIGGFVRHHEGPSYVTAALAYGWQNVTTERVVTIVNADRLRANFTANAFSARIEAGHRSVASWLGGVGVTPHAAAQVTNVDLPAYAETLVSGEDNFALNYTGRNVTAARSELGFRADKSFALDQALLTLRGRVAWAHDFNRDRVAQASFQSLLGASFVVNGAAMAPDAALASGSAEVMLGNGFSLAATYEGEFSSVTRSHAGKGVVRFTW